MKKLLIDKKDNYAKYVKEMHLPHKSKKKEKELQELREALHHPVRHTVKYPPGSVLEGITRSQHRLYDHSANSKKSGRASQRSNTSRSPPRPKLNNYRSTRPPLPFSVLKDENKRVIHTDYLKERRKKRE